MSSTDRRDCIVVPIDGGVAELVPDPGRPAGWTLLIEGVAQSYVDLDDPVHLEFPYVRRVASVIDTLVPRAAPLRVLHLGAGAMTIPRYIGARRPGSEQTVIERDPALVILVHERIPVPPGAGITIHIESARRAVEAAPDQAYDLVIADAYNGATMPRDLTSIEYVREIARLLSPTGMYVVNVTDLPTLAFTRIQAATLRQTFADVCAFADVAMMRGRKFGNVVLVASSRPDALRPRAMARPRRGELAPAKVMHGDDLVDFIAGARPRTDAEAAVAPDQLA
jgi:spermidine synthase